VRNLRQKRAGRACFRTLAVTAVLCVFSAMTLPAAAQQGGPLNVNDVAEQMAPDTLKRVDEIVVEPLKDRFPDRAAVIALLGEPRNRKVTTHQSIHDPDYVFQGEVLEYDESRITFYVFPDREVFCAFQGDPTDAGIGALHVGQAAADVEKLLGQSVRWSKEMLYSDGEWWLVLISLDKKDRLQSMEVYIFFD